MRSDRQMEERIGLFDVAVSFQDDAMDMALRVKEFCDFQNIRCYFYCDVAVLQCGLDIYEVMRWAYTRTPRVIILNTLLYRSTMATQFEFDVISGAGESVEVFVFELGGEAIGCKNARWRSVSAWDTVTILQSIGALAG